MRRRPRAGAHDTDEMYERTTEVSHWSSRVRSVILASHRSRIRLSPQKAYLATHRSNLRQPRPPESPQPVSMILVRNPA